MNRNHGIKRHTVGTERLQFTPPIQEHDISAWHEREDGTADIVSLIIMDSLNRAYTLRIVTQVRAEMELREEAGTEDPEPEFIIPGDMVEVTDVEAILTLPPTLLSKFLVLQEE